RRVSVAASSLNASRARPPAGAASMAFRNRHVSATFVCPASRKAANRSGDASVASVTLRCSASSAKLAVTSLIRPGRSCQAGAGGGGGGRGGELHRVAQGPGDARGLADVFLQGLAGLALGVGGNPLGLVAEQVLRLAEDDGQRVVDFVAGARREFRQGGQLRF